MANEEQPKLSVTVSNKTDFASFYLNETFSDIRLILKNRELCAHKIVLATRSKYFASILLNNPDKDVLILNEVSFDAFEKLLLYLYTGSLEIDDNEELIFDLLKLIDSQSDKDLAETLMAKISTLLSVSNVCNILNNANFCNIYELRDICHEFIEKHATDFLMNDFLNLLTQQSIVNFLKQDNLSLREIDVFNLAKKWCEANQDVDSLVINCVRLSCLSKKEILNFVWPSKLIDANLLFPLFAEIECGKMIIPHRNHQPKDIKEALQALKLSPEELMNDLYSENFVEKMPKLTIANVFLLLKLANSYDLNKLKTICYSYMASIGREVLSDDHFYELSKESIIKLLERDDFLAPENDIFQSVVKWCKVNKTRDESILGCVRLSHLSLLAVKEIISIIWPCQIIQSDKLLESISDIIDGKSKEEMASIRLWGITKLQCFVIDDHAVALLSSRMYFSTKKSIIIELDTLFTFNYIAMKISGSKKSCYSYSIEVSVDCINWHMVVNYENVSGHPKQELRFSKQTAKFIKLRRTDSYNQNRLEMYHFGVYGA